MPNTPVSFEPISNVGFVCSKHRPKPDPHIMTVVKLDPLGMIGGFAKKSFPAKDPDGGDNEEHMWVELLSWHDGYYMGKLNNDPVYDTGDVIFGSMVKVLIEEIEDIMT